MSGDGVTTLEPDADLLPFYIEGSRIKTLVPLNFERQNKWAVAVRVADPSGFDLVQRFTINVTDENDVPTLLELDSSSVPELAAGSPIGRLSTVDEDAGQTYTYVTSREKKSVKKRERG